MSLSWESEEVWRWIDNDSGLYQSCYDNAGRYRVRSGNALREIVGRIEGVDMDEVQWNALHDAITEAEETEED